MKIKSKIKAGDSGDKLASNHNQTVTRGLKVRSNIKAGGMNLQHNQTIRKG
jgi:hypothetical protein